MEITTIQLVQLGLLAITVILLLSNLYWRLPMGLIITLGEEKKLTGGKKLKFAYQFPMWRPVINIEVKRE